jgi:hypothetical protein
MAKKPKLDAWEPVLGALKDIRDSANFATDLLLIRKESGMAAPDSFRVARMDSLKLRFECDWIDGNGRCVTLTIKPYQKPEVYSWVYFEGSSEMARGTSLLDFLKFYKTVKEGSL